MNRAATSNHTATPAVAAGGTSPSPTGGEVEIINDARRRERSASIQHAFARRRVRASGSRLARVAATTATALLLSIGLTAAPAHAFRWTRGTVSPHVIDCRSGTICMRGGQIDWVETCRQFRDQHETFCESEGL